MEFPFWFCWIMVSCSCWLMKTAPKASLLAGDMLLTVKISFAASVDWNIIIPRRMRIHENIFVVSLIFVLLAMFLRLDVSPWLSFKCVDFVITVSWIFSASCQNVLRPSLESLTAGCSSGFVDVRTLCVSMLNWSINIFLSSFEAFYTLSLTWKWIPQVPVRRRAYFTK